MKCYENLVKADINIYAENLCCLVLEEENIETYTTFSDRGK